MKILHIGQMIGGLDVYIRNIKKDLIIRWCAYGGVLVILISALDGILANFFNIRINDWFVFGFSGNASYFNRAV